MSTITFTLCLIAGGVVLAAMASRLLPRFTEASDQTLGAPRLAHMEKLSEALTKGITLLTAVLGIVAAREGGLGRLVANGDEFLFAVGCALASVLLAFAAWTVVAAAPEKGLTGFWLVTTVLSLALFTGAAYGVMRANESAVRKLERPAVGMEQTAQGLKVTASIDLLKADAFMRTTVHGYVPGGGAQARELLFNSTSGPDAKGKASMTGVVTRDLSRYEVVEVRAFRGSEDPGCETPGAEGLSDARGPAACASIWITPKTGT